MAKSLKASFPPPDEVLNLAPEEIGVFLLDYLCELGDDSQSLNRYNFTLQSGELGSYAGEKYDAVAKVITEAWIWLEREGMIAPKPGVQGE